jgi:hypothetical protein
VSEFSKIGTNAGHGHAWPRPDGVRARCGGVVLCRECAADNSLVERWRRTGAHSAAAEHGPIDPAFHAEMNALAGALDTMFNGKDCKAEDKKIGFFLTTFEMDAPGRFNYISNADKIDVRAMLKEIVARIEGRMSAGSAVRQ